jgi:uncharacterized repeat protein (TIGR04052 family)
VGNKIARCGETYAGVGSSNASILLQDFRIYVSNARLIGRNGEETPIKLTPDGKWQNDQVTLLDFENASGNCNGNADMNMSLRGEAPKGDYTGLAFDIGVPYEINHKDPTLASAPMNVTALTWPWRIGYKFTTIDLETTGGAMSAMTPKKVSAQESGHAMPGMRMGPGMKMGEAASGFSIHLGSTDCGEGSPMSAPTAPCGNPNRATYRLAKFDARKQTVVLDLAALLAKTDVTVNAPGSSSGCMSFADDDDCIAIMDRFGLGFRGKASSGQAFVRTG